MNITESELIENFPFKEVRSKQLEGMKQIAEAINEGYKIIILEAPTGFGKSPVAIALAKTLGSSYVCSATKDLQSQYTKDFPFLRSVKGMNNYDCLAKEDFILNGSYLCKSCGINQKEKRANKSGLDQYIFGNDPNIKECRHKTVGYGPCRGESNNAAYEHVRKNCPACSHKFTFSNGNSNFHDGCRYRTFPEDYEISSQNTDEELIFINPEKLVQYHEYSTDNSDSLSGWMHLKNITNKKALENRTLNNFSPCPYYDQLHKGMLASHTIFNYANFLIFLSRSGPGAKNPILRNKGLLVLDEGHQIENQIVEDVGINITKKTLKRYIQPTAIDILENSQLNYDSDIETEWLVLLQDLYVTLDDSIKSLPNGEVKTDVKQYQQKLLDTIVWIKEDPNNWIVSEIVFDPEDQNQKISPVMDKTFKKKINKIVFKPLDVSPYCSAIFELTDVTLIMSATILDVDTFCHNIGLNRDKVKFIEMPSEFPIENRPIYPMNIAHLNYANLKIDRIHRKIAASIDRIMDYHSNEKGIIHTTSYSQVNFIKSFLSEQNQRRLISTDPEIPRDEIITKHYHNENSAYKEKANSVLISPSLHTGLDLKDEQSRFQILVKVPYPSLGDRWIKKKQTLDGGKWYRWQTVLKTVQAYGRSVRSKDDWAKTYLLDASFDNFISTNKFPQWFLKALMSCPHAQQIQ